MPAIRIGAKTLVLLGTSEIALERNSPLLNPPEETGNSSMAIKAARVPQNDAILNYPARFDHVAGRPTERFDGELLDDNGAQLLECTVVLRGIEADFYDLNLEFGASEVMNRLRGKNIRSLLMGGLLEMRPANPLLPTSDFANYFANQELFMNETVADWPTRPYTFAPFSNDDCDGKWDVFQREYDQDNQQFNVTNPPPLRPVVSFNAWTGRSFTTAPPIVITIPGGVVYNPPTPRPRKIVPLVKVSHVLRCLFQELRLVLITDVFDEPEMDALVFVPSNGILRQLPTRNGVSVGFAGFKLADNLPDLNGAELLRKLMDTLGLHFDTTLAGECRLLRTDAMIKNTEAVDITPRVSPRFSTVLEAATSVTARNYLAEKDRWAQEWASQPEAIDGTVAAVADLPAPPVAGDQHFLVTSLARFYVSESYEDTTVTPSVSRLRWVPGAYYYPEPTVGTAPEPEDYQVANALAVAEPFPYQFINNAGAVITYNVKSLTFLEPSYHPTDCPLPATKELRLAFYRGLQPLPDAYLIDFLSPLYVGQQATIPWLTQGNLSPAGVRIGNYSLEVGGSYGLVRKLLQPLLAMKAAHDKVRFTTTFTAQEYTALDFGKTVSIRGDYFMVSRASITLPRYKPGTIELMPRRSVEPYLT